MAKTAIEQFEKVMGDEVSVINEIAKVLDFFGVQSMSAFDPQAYVTCTAEDLERRVRDADDWRESLEENFRGNLNIYKQARAKEHDLNPLWANPRAVAARLAALAAALALDNAIMLVCPEELSE